MILSDSVHLVKIQKVIMIHMIARKDDMTQKLYLSHNGVRPDMNEKILTKVRADINIHRVIDGFQQVDKGSSYQDHNQQSYQQLVASARRRRVLMHFHGDDGYSAVGVPIRAPKYQMRLWGDQ